MVEIGKVKLIYFSKIKNDRSVTCNGEWWWAILLIGTAKVYLYK